MIPNWEGGQQFRKFTLAGDRLILEPPAIQAAGQKRVRRLTWERVSPLPSPAQRERGRG